MSLFCWTQNNIFW